MSAQNTKFWSALKLWLPLLMLTLIAPITDAQESIPLPPLTGVYAVGITELQFTDPARQEIFTDDPDDLRELVATVYYPAEATADAQTAPYVDDTFGATASEHMGIDVDIWPLVTTHILPQAPFANDAPAFPVIFFSPGFGNLPFLYSTLLAEIASHGYVVMSISRPYSTPLTLFPDGRLVEGNDDGAPFGSSFPDELERRERVGAVWAADIQFLIDQLEILNRDDPLLAGYLDTSQIGVLGHSYGGAASVLAAHLDERIGAVSHMDGTLFGAVALEGLAQPFLLMEPADPPYEDPDQLPSDEQIAELGITRAEFEVFLFYANYQMPLQESSAAHRLRFTGARHNLFTTDLAYLKIGFPGRLRGINLGTINSERTAQTISRYNVGFFDQYLKGQDSPLLGGEMGDDPDVQLESF